jgi:two-component system phosphate regulon sensor histidine kinase PhoR
MTARPYKLIFTLLTGSVLCVLALQAFWIRNFYLQKKDEFNKTVYSALEKVSAKISERENLRAVKEQASFMREVHLNEPPPPRGKAIKVVSGTYAQVRNPKKGHSEISITRVEGVKNQLTQVMVSDSSLTIFNDEGMTVSRQVKKSKNAKKDSALNRLMDKMLLEIKIQDTGERNPDTLRTLIKQVFANKGLFLPFEFALKKVFKNKDETLARSAGFKETLDSYVTDLSADKVFSTHNFLFVQFRGDYDFMFSSMKNILLLSLAFSLLMVSIFYYTMRLILNQKKLGEVKNDFVNNMTHELKTPIATISLAMDSMADPQVKNSEERFNEYTRIVKEENKKLNDHVERVLQMALLDKGELRLHRENTGLTTLIAEAIASYRLQIREQNAKVLFHPPAQEIYVSADKFHLQKVFSNLLDNALKYSRENCTVQITLTEAAGQVQVSFIDNGIGIDNSQAEKIFEQFYRVQGGNLHDVKGFGLGLSYARSIVEAHGGSISLQNNKGGGSIFTIQLNKHGR